VADDCELMARVREGEQSALELLLARWESPVFRFFYRLGCPPDRVEDLTEEVLVAVYRQRHRYDPGRPFAPWLFGIARLVWKEYRRQLGRELSYAVPLSATRDMAASDRSPADLAEAREEAEVVRRAIECLPEDERAAFILRHYQGLSYAEITQALQAPLGTVKWWIHEGVRHLEASLKLSLGRGG